jgi:hypothetical protein
VVDRRVSVVPRTRSCQQACGAACVGRPKPIGSDHLGVGDAASAVTCATSVGGAERLTLSHRQAIGCQVRRGSQGRQAPCPGARPVRRRRSPSGRGPGQLEVDRGQYLGVGGWWPTRTAPSPGPIPRCLSADFGVETRSGGLGCPKGSLHGRGDGRCLGGGPAEVRTARRRGSSTSARRGPRPSRDAGRDVGPALRCDAPAGPSGRPRARGPSCGCPVRPCGSELWAEAAEPRQAPTLT